MIKVACIGDSITQGFTLLRPGRDSYPSVLQRMLGEDYEVRNFGVLDAAARFDSDTPFVRKKAYRKSLEWNPDIVLLMLGYIDTKRRNWDPEIFRVMGIPLMGLYPETMEEGVRPAILEIAEHMNLPFIDLEGLFQNKSYCIDGVHPQRKGARMIAEHIHYKIFRD